MKKLLITAAVSALAFAAPAAAQSTNGYGWGNANARAGAGLDNRIARLEARIDAGVRSGAISRSEERSLRQELRTLSRLENRYSRNGFSEQERADLRMRVQAFRENLRLAGGMGNGNDRWGSRYPDDRGQYPNDRDRYPNDRDRYPGDGGYGQGGPYDPVCYDDNRGRSSSGGLGGLGGLGGIIDSIFGGNDRNDENCETTLRVGQRVSGNLGAVPYHLRSRFRDGGGVYYRSDGRAIYQIDARSHTVVRIYDVD